MTLHVIGAGLGRTGTNSLKLAIEHLGLGPCHHMEEVPEHPEQVPLWSAALGGHADWNALYRGYESAVDWPTAAFLRDLAGVYPLAKFVLTLRDADTWAESFSKTIYKLVSERGQAPAPMHPLLRMIDGVVRRTGLSEGLDAAALARAFVSHNEEVKATIPASRLLTYQVTEGWEPLCRFIGTPVPREPFPHTNRRNEFWANVAAKTRSL